MSNWEHFIKSSHAGKNFASLNASSTNPMLSFLLRGRKELNIQKGEKFDLYFDRERMAIGMKRSDTGLKVTQHNNNVLSLAARSFCKTFDLDGKYIVETYETEGDMIVLPLTKI